jgi:hypothetical protein
VPQYVIFFALFLDTVPLTIVDEPKVLIILVVNHIQNGMEIIKN